MNPIRKRWDWELTRGRICWSHNDNGVGNLCIVTSADEFYDTKGIIRITTCFSGVRVTQSLVLCVLVCRSLFVLLQELITLPEHMSSLPVFNRVRVTQSLVFCVMFCRSLFVILREWIQSVNGEAGNWPVDGYVDPTMPMGLETFAL
jgi:hypothetical protein